jgi:precorrin-6x reductase
MSPNEPASRNLVWLFSGTSDGNAIGLKLINSGYSIKLFVATDYGKEVALKSFPADTIHTGRLDREQLLQKEKEDRPKTVIDATHPFAAEISANLIELCKRTSANYVRFERPNDLPSDKDIHIVANYEEAARKADQLGRRILLTTGSKEIDTFFKADIRGELFLRMLPSPKLLQEVLAKGMHQKNIVAMQGPFSLDTNQSLIERWQIDCLVTKASGKEGGLLEKIEAARICDIPVVVIDRPKMDYPVVFNEVDSLLDYLQEQ